MKIPTNELSQAKRESLAWISFAIILVATMGFGAVFFLRDVPNYFGYNMQRELTGWGVVGVGLIGISVMSVLVYVAGILWLLLAKFFFSRDEVSKINYYGPTSPIERWLFNKFFPEERS